MRFAVNDAKVRAQSQTDMKPFKIQWLTQDNTLWEADWLRHIFREKQDFIDVEFEWEKIKTDENTILICNHAVPYRKVLDELRQKGKRYGIVLLSDENLIDPCEWLHDPNCVGLLRNYINPYIINHPKVTTFGLGCKVGLVKKLEDKEGPRELIWSFAGTLHGDRGELIETMKTLKPFKVHKCSGFNAADGLSTEDYASLLKSSKYALCPPGQDSMDSFRLYEALEAGCIPVCLKNTGNWHIHPSYWHGVFFGEETLPFIHEDTWEQCLSEINNIEQTDKYKQKQTECAAFWNKWKEKWQKDGSKLIEKLL